MSGRYGIEDALLENGMACDKGPLSIQNIRNARIINRASTNKQNNTLSKISIYSHSRPVTTSWVS
jgi:hypothetical protein